jgi:parallel beta-helix repeat protein
MRKALIIALAFLLLIPLARADTYLTSCAILDTPGETYYLTTDIIYAPPIPPEPPDYMECIFIDANNVTLDCQWHTIHGPGINPPPPLFVGIYVNNSINITIKNCVMTDLNHGIFLSSSSSSTLSNIIANSNEHGIYFDYSNSSTLSNITANYNNFGTVLYFSYYNTLSNITTNYNNYYGIHIVYSSSNTIKNSIIQGNSQGINLYSTRIPTDLNLIYNNLFNNTNNFYFNNPYGIVYLNNWNTTRQVGTRIYSAGTEIGGNYWTNPDGTGYSDTCIDADKDGFCDDPYVLNANNTDYLALSDEYSPPPTTTTTTLPPVHGVPLLSSTLVGVVIGFGIITFMLRTLFDIREPKKVIEYFIVLAVIVLTVLSLIVLFG